jgi:hypothetical protein
MQPPRPSNVPVQDVRPAAASTTKRGWQPPAVTRLSVVDNTLSKGAAGLDVDMESS